MEDNNLRDEIEMRMNPEDFTIKSIDLIDIINMFDIDEQIVVQVYSELVEEKQNEIKETTEEVFDYFREKGNYYPSFEEFKKIFNQYENNFIDNNILRDMYKQKINDKNQMSLFEMQQIIKEELKNIHERNYEFDEFDDEDEQISRAEKNWGGALEPEEEFDAEEFFGAAGDAAEEDIKAEFGDDEFTPFGTMEDPRMLKDLEEDTDNHVISPNSGLFRPQDSNGNDIKTKSLVQHVDSNKRGYVMGFGDDGAGNLIVRVDWAWPVEMKFKNPKEMGEMKESPENLIVQNIDEETSNIDAVDEKIEEIRGLGSGIKNSGDRNIKMRDDHMRAPLTNLNESIDVKIKGLMETKITKKDLQEFISEEAKRVAKQLKR